MEERRGCGVGSFFTFQCPREQGRGVPTGVAKASCHAPTPAGPPSASLLGENDLGSGPLSSPPAPWRSSGPTWDTDPQGVGGDSSPVSCPPPCPRSMAHPSTWFDPASLPCGLGMAPQALGPPQPLRSLLSKHTSVLSCHPSSHPPHLWDGGPQGRRSAPGPTQPARPTRLCLTKFCCRGSVPGWELPVSPVPTVKRFAMASSGAAGMPAHLLLSGVTFMSSGHKSLG